MCQAYQLPQSFREILLTDLGWSAVDTMLLADTPISEAGFRLSDIITGLILVGLVSSVIFGGIRRIGSVASRLVPLMVVVYVLTVLVIIFKNFSDLPYYVGLIISDADTCPQDAGTAFA